LDPYRWPERPSQLAFPIARAGYPLIGGAAFATLVLAMLGLTPWAIGGLLTTAAVALFFRDPDRVTPTREGALVSPADGRVVCIERVPADPFADGERIRIGIFMSVFNVHVNRVPCSGTVSDVRYQPGRFLAANRAAAGERNEHNAVRLKTAAGDTVCWVQIAGLIARRIICRLQPGDAVLRGERFGMICFGSRVDLYLPPQSRVEVQKGDRVRAGATVLGRLGGD
jgi:phosphatidylserine decarboxylase